MNEVEDAHLVVRSLAVGATTVITPAGEIDVASAPLLSAVVDQAIASRTGKIIIDCSDVSYLDSSGVRALVIAWDAMQDKAAIPVVVSNLQPQVRRVLDICGITSLVVG